MSDNIRPGEASCTAHEKPHDVLIIGAGFSGVCMGKKLLEAGRADFIILEKTDGIGGTWYKNTYPGAACDVPSHFYSLSFAPNPNWSRVYSPQAEIQSYIEKCANDFNITPHILNNCAVKGAKFDEGAELWNVEVEDGRVFKARNLIMGSGGLNTPTIPELDGKNTFEGPSFHTAQWQHEVDLEGKNVVVIGSAASAIQLIPQVAKKANKVTVFQRTPNYIMPRMDRAYSEKELNSFRRHPWRLKFSRLRQFLRFELFLTPLFKRESRLRKKVRDQFLKYLKSTIKDPVLVEKLIPDYELGCKRILISDDFFPSLNRSNVEVVTDGIAKITKDAVVDGTGKAHEADVIVYATGFDLKKQMVSIELEGEGGVRLSDFWKDEALAYEGAMIPGFPNVYFVTGPNTGVGSTSVVYMIEAQSKFIMTCLEKAGTENLLQPKLEATKAKYNKIQQDLENTVWASGCKSWYIDESGKNHTLYPHSAGHFKRQRRHVNWLEFDIKSAAKMDVAAE